jgi:diaminohydroxyphosphoribosylaminopyrimidine deaminase/5-amino-6-(5-phosphoribosylamino)uracil reductase
MDDPSLLPRGDFIRSPSRVVVDSNLRIPIDARVVREAGRSPVIVAATSATATEKARDLKERGVAIWKLPELDGRVDASALMERLASEGIIEVICEGGPSLAGSLIEGGLADRISLFIAPKLLGPSGIDAFGGFPTYTMNTIMELDGLNAHRSGGDLLIDVPLSEYN